MVAGNASERASGLPCAAVPHANRVARPSRSPPASFRLPFRFPDSLKGDPSPPVSVCVSVCVGCGTGTASNGSPITITITVIGTCTFTVTGALNAAQVELGAFGTSFIVTAGASATRAADVPQLIGPAATAALAAKSAFFQTNGVEGFTTAIVYLGFSPAGSMYSPTTTSVGIYAGTGTDATAALGSGTTASTVKAAFGFDASGLSSRANGGTKATSVTPWATGLSTPVLGNRPAGDRALNGYMQRFALSPVKGVYDASTQLPYLLKRDVIPGTPANDNTPMYLNEAA